MYLPKNASKQTETHQGSVFFMCKCSCLRIYIHAHLSSHDDHRRNTEVAFPVSWPGITVSWLKSPVIIQKESQLFKMEVLLKGGVDTQVLWRVYRHSRSYLMHQRRHRTNISCSLSWQIMWVRVEDCPRLTLWDHNRGPREYSSSVFILWLSFLEDLSQSSGKVCLSSSSSFCTRIREEFLAFCLFVFLRLLFVSLVRVHWDDGDRKGVRYCVVFYPPLVLSVAVTPSTERFREWMKFQVLSYSPISWVLILLRHSRRFFCDTQKTRILRVSSTPTLTLRTSLLEQQQTTSIVLTKLEVKDGNYFGNCVDFAAQIPLLFPSCFVLSLVCLVSESLSCCLSLTKSCCRISYVFGCYYFFRPNSYTREALFSPYLILT